ncbi:MAG: tRNA-(ms[2]io[6]A)-hydroxylase [Deltaproteobacteria bacterium]|nr:tRNA-(ms[2]io[6]A)-hydroxylase [Deltaproteobacteria bacterium]
MLHLASTSSRAWLERAIAGIDEVLVDHAHCERKAAATALQLVTRYPDRTALVVPLSELAREELEHFELVVSVIRARGGAFSGMKASPYASELMRLIRRQEPHQLLDSLLCSALIEARSCERMQLLAEALPDPSLQKLYKGLLASEARHHALYVDLARACFPDPLVRDRLAEIAQHEAAVIATAPPWPRMHC